MEGQGVKPELGLDEVRALLSYDAETGEFRWLASRPGVKAGALAGSADGQGYLRVWINGRRYPCHRLAWFYVHGRWPPDQLDHIDGNRSRNAIANLREATHHENQRNRGANSNSASGYKGVSWHEAHGKWRAVIHFGGRQIWLGWFASPVAAHEAYLEAAKRLHGEFAKV